MNSRIYFIFLLINYQKQLLLLTKSEHLMIFQSTLNHSNHEVNKQIEKMLAYGIIKPSISPWSSPLWVVPKKTDASGEKKWRIVMDYRKLNETTISDAYPQPNIEDILDQLGHAQ